MTISLNSSGTQTATVTTEHTLATINTAGRFRLIVDTVNLAANDVVELRAKQIVLTGGTARVVELGVWYGAQPADEVMKVSGIIDNELTDTGSVLFTLKQTFGTGRVFPWKVLNLDVVTPTNFSTLSIDGSGRVTIVPGQIVVKKNTALTAFSFLMRDSTDHITPKTGLTITATISIDGAAFGACTNSATELSNGVYLITLAAADLNGNVITLKFTATGADQRTITILTQP